MKQNEEKIHAALPSSNSFIDTLQHSDLGIICALKTGFQSRFTKSFSDQLQNVGSTELQSNNTASSHLMLYDNDSCVHVPIPGLDYSLDEISGIKSVHINDKYSSMRNSCTPKSIYGNTAFAADQNVIRSDFEERQRVMRLHYNLHVKCRLIVRLFVVLLCLVLSIVIIFEMSFAHGERADDMLDNGLMQNSLLFSMMNVKSVSNFEWYWLTFVLCAVVVYHSLVFFIYWTFMSIVLMFRQMFFERLELDPIFIPCIMCYYCNQCRLENIDHKIHSMYKISAICSDGRKIKNYSDCYCFMYCKRHCLCGYNDILSSVGAISPRNGNIGGINDDVNQSFFEIDDYGSVGVFFKYFCCYFRCCNSCHYGLRHTPNAHHLIQFFDPLKDDEIHKNNNEAEV